MRARFGGGPAVYWAGVLYAIDVIAAISALDHDESEPPRHEGSLTG